MSSTIGRAAFGFGAVVAPALIPGPAGILLGGGFAIAGALLYRPKRNDASEPNIQAPKGSPNRSLPIVFGTDVPQDVGVDFFGNVRKVEQKESTKGGQDVTTGFQVLADMGFSICRGPGVMLKLWREGELVYDIEGAGVFRSLSGSLRTYNGTPDQLPDPVEQALYGIEDTPAYLDIVRFTLQDHDISDLNRMPIFKAKVTRLPSPAYPKDEIALNVDFKTSTTSWDGQFFVFAQANNTITFLNNETQQVAFDGPAGISFTDQHLRGPGIDFDNNLYVGIDGVVTNTSVARLNAPDYLTFDQSSNRATGGGWHVQVSHLPIARLVSEQVLFAMSGLNMNAWRLDASFPGTRAIDNLDLEGSSGINVSLQGPAGSARDPITGDFWVFIGDNTVEQSFYAAVFSVSPPALIDGANGSLQYSYSEASTANVASACYVPQTHEMAVIVGTPAVNGAGIIYFIDVDTRQLVEKFPLGKNIELESIGYATFANGPDENGRIFVHLADVDSRQWLEVDLVRREVLLEYDMENWGIPALSTNQGAARYDPLRRALWLDSSGETAIAYLDRFTGAGVNLAEVTAELIDETDLDSVLDFNGTDVESVIINGATYNDGSAATFLQSLYDFHNCRLIDSGWKLKGKQRGGPPVFAIETKHLGAAPEGSTAPQLNRPRTAPLSLPQRYEVGYRNINNYQNSTQGHPRALDAVVSRDQTRVSYPGVLSDDEAKSGAIQQISIAYLEAQSYDTTAPPKFLNVEPADIGTIQDGNEIIEVEVAEHTYGANGVIDLKTVRMDDSALTQQGTGAPNSIPPDVIQPVLSTTPVIFDTALPFDTLEGATPLIQISGTQETDEPRGATIQRSPDGVGSWADYAVLDPSRIIQHGTLRTSLGPGTTRLVDDVNTFQVALARGSLASAIRNDAMNDETINAYYMPTDDGFWQLGQFIDATLQGDGSYICSALIRGRKNDENHLTTTQGKKVYFPNVNNVLVKSIPLSEVGVTFFFRAVTFGSNRPGPVVAYTFLGMSKETYSGIDPHGTLDGNNDWHIDWMSRSRLSAAYGLNAPPLAEAIFDFEADMLDGPQGDPVANATIRTTATVNGSVITTDNTSTRRQTMVIEEADQVFWFGSVQTTIHLAIYQLSDSLGRGEPLYVTFNG